MKDIKFWWRVFEKDKDWPKRVKELLENFGVKLLGANFQPLEGGLRKVCFRVKAKQGDLVLAFWPPGSLSKKKIISSLKLEDQVGRKGILPTRRWIKLREKKERGVVKFKVGGYQFWLGALTFLAGKPIWKLGPEHIFQIGEALGKLHSHFWQKEKDQTFLHLDFARSNLLFDKKGKLCGVLDFEEARWGEVEEDLGCTFSFLVVDNLQLKLTEIEKVFLSGYQQDGSIFDYDKMIKHFDKYLKKRMKENKQSLLLRNKQSLLLRNSKELVLAQAKKRLAVYQQQIKAKILTSQGLAFWAQKHRGKKIVFAVGAFELLHWGHLEFLKKAKRLGDLLVVGVASDESRRRMKGKPYPLVSDRTRAETLAYFGDIDGVVVVAEDNVEEVLKKLKPKFFYTAKRDWEEGPPAGGQGVRKQKEADLVKKWRGKVVKVDYYSPRISSSQMADKVALLKIKHLILSKVKRQPILKFKKGKKIAKEVKPRDLKRLKEGLHQQGKTVVFTSLTADLFHLGHARFILKAKSLGDVLVVGVPNNESVRAMKGLSRPMVDEKARALVLAELETVDKVVFFDERTVLGCLRKLKPDIFFTVKEDWNKNFFNSPEAAFMKSIGSKIVRSARQAPYLSASKMIDKAAGELIQKKFADILKTAQQTPVLDADEFDPYDPKVQLAARERGFYEQVLAAVAKRGKCVFCDLKEKYLLTEKDGVVLTVALFPYTDGHLLIIPRRHINSLSELNQKEWQTVLDLTKKGIKILEKKLGVKDVWFLLREGRGIKAGKTVNHLHFHLIPYSPEVIKMGETKLKMKPVEVAEKLRVTRKV